MVPADSTSRRKIFHGWYIVGVAILSNASASIGNYAFGLFIDPMGQSLGWSRTAMSWSLTIRSLLSMIVAPVLGPFVDRKHGAKSIMAGGGVVLGVGLILISGVQHLWQFYLLFGIASGVATVAVGPQLVTPTIISKWFIRKRGRAVAISTVGNNVGGVVFIPLAAYIILNHGWRAAWLVIGVLAFVFITPLSLLFVRRMPEDIGLLPDGDVSREETQFAGTTDSGNLRIEDDWPLKDAIKTPTLWLIVIACTLGGVGFGGLPVHVIPALVDKGYSLSYASGLITLFSFLVIVCKPVWGFLGERIQVRYLMMASFLIAAAGVGVLVPEDIGSYVLLFPVVYAVGISGYLPLMNVIWADYFGRSHLGAIRGLVMPITQVSMAFSPVGTGYIFDTRGDYFVAFIIYIVCYVFSTMTIFLARKPETRSSA